MGSDLVSRVASRALTLKVPGTVNLVAAARDPGQGQTFSLPNDFTIEAITIQIVVLRAPPKMQLPCPWTVINKERTKFQFASDSIFRPLVRSL